MTLNITLVTPTRIYQSGDFRLSHIPEHGGRPAPTTPLPPSMKVVTLQYWEFFGFVTYTGIGSIGGRSTAEFVLDWLEGKDGLGIDDVADLLVDRGTRWLRRHRDRDGNSLKHTFVVAGFSSKTPKAIMVSNFQDGVRQPWAPTDQLIKTRLRVTQRSRVIVTGASDTVDRLQRRYLQRLADHDCDEAAKIRYAIKKVNEVASTRSGGSVSPDCSVVSMALDGSGMQELSEESHVELHSIMNGFSSRQMNKMLKDAGITGTPKGMSFATSAGGPRLPVRCEPSITKPDGADRYELSLLPVQEFASAAALSTSDDGHALGTFTLFENPGQHVYCVWDAGDHRHDYGFYAVNERSACISDRDHFVCSAIADDGDSVRAARYATPDITDLGTYLGRDSGATGVNAKGQVVGWVRIDQTDRGQLAQRPARWNAKNVMQVMDLTHPEVWGVAMSVNAHGVALVSLHKGLQGDNGILLWSEDGSAENITPASNNVIPMGVDDNGTVIGFVNVKDGPLAVIRRPGQNWEQLGTPMGFYPTAINNVGAVVGAIPHEGFRAPAIWANGTLTLMPTIRYHECLPLAVNNHGEVVGHARTDHGEHAIRWRPGS
ncbi:MAG TPA: hypothetical protein VFB74_12790 [Kribbellaceae bacterium]|nr:hypothetical protein [Kribbellaceae bacterium]